MEQREQVITLGQRLARTARRAAERRLPALPWLRSLQPAMARVQSLPLVLAAHFERRESAGLRQVELATPADGRADASEWAPWKPLDPHVRAGLRDVVGPGFEGLRVHDDDRADQFARGQRADAVAVGQDVFFRRGRFRPQDDAGFALLAHEAAHVVQAMRPGAAWRRATHAGAQHDESEAAGHERRALALRRGPSLGSPALEPSSMHPRAGAAHEPRSSALAVGTTPVTRPMTAATDRPIVESVHATPPPIDFERMRSELYRDLMSQIRADFERGA